MQIGDYIFGFQPYSMGQEYDIGLNSAVTLNGLIISKPQYFLKNRTYEVYLFEDETELQLENFLTEVKKGKVKFIDELNIPHEAIVKKASLIQKLTIKSHPVYEIKLEVDIL